MAAVNSNADLATSLDYQLNNPLLEQKFNSLKVLHLKKIKSLMSSINNQQKEINKLKILSKDSHRTQIIQNLKKKLKNLEYINDVLKEEITVKQMKEEENEKEDDEENGTGKINYEKINSYIVRKTISGPKRYRPLTREELELQIIELEKKLKMKSTTTTTTTNGNGTEKGMKETAANNSQPPPLNSSASGKKSLSSRDGNGSGNGKGESKEENSYLMRISELQEALSESQHLSSRHEQTITQLKQEITRLRSLNSELLVIEEERDAIERQFNDLTLRYDNLIEELDESTHQQQLTQEESYQLKLEYEMDVENYGKEIEILREQYEKSLKQNTQLLKNLTELENLFGKNSRTLTSSSTGNGDGTGAGNGAGVGVGADSKTDLRASNSNLNLNSNNLTEKLKIATARISQLENQLNHTVRTSNDTAQEILTLKSTLREKNNYIRDMKRNMNVVTKAYQSNSATLATTTNTTNNNTHNNGGHENSSLYGKFINAMISYELMMAKPSSSSASSSSSSSQIKNQLFRYLDELLKLFSNQKLKKSSSEEIQIENLQKFEHLLLSRHPEIGMDEQEDEDELNGVHITGK